MTRGHYPFCRRYREACLALLVVIVLPLSGCELFSFIAQGVVQPKTKARFTLHDQSTVVLVDDPEGSLGNPTLPNVIANRVAFELKQNMAVTTIVPPDRLHALAATAGKGYRRMPVDQIGRELGAQQVIHVHVESVQLQAEPGLYRPIAAVRVKVIDAIESRRLFPTADHHSADPNSALFERGELLMVQIDYKVAGVTPRTEAMVVSRRLANHIGHKIARLFYDYTDDTDDENIDLQARAPVDHANSSM